MPDARGSAGQDSRLARVIRGLVVAACFVPIAHLATCARHGHENSQSIPLRGPNDPGPFVDLDALIPELGRFQRILGTVATLLAIGLLLGVLLRGKHFRPWASVLYGPLLLIVGLLGLRHPDLHRWVWASLSTLAAAILCAFGASRCYSRWRGPSSEHASNIAILCACALALLFALLNLPTQTANRVLSTSSLSWTYHLAELTRDPYERIPGWECRTLVDRCDCLESTKEGARASCDDQRCCYGWDVTSFTSDPFTYRVEHGCFCVAPDPSRGACPSVSSVRSVHNANTWREESCP